MAKGYWVTTYRSVSDPDALAKYAGLAAPLILARGGRFLVRGLPVRTPEGAGSQRCVVVEFDTVDAAIAAYESPEYQKAAAILSGKAERDLRIVEGA